MVLSENIVTALYIAASVLFILSLGGLSGQKVQNAPFGSALLGWRSRLLGLFSAQLFPLHLGFCLY